MKMLYETAQKGVMIARLIAAAAYGVFAILLLVFALWLVLPLGQSWLMIIFAVFFGISGFTTLAKAAEIFVSAKPPEWQRPQQKRQQERDEQSERRRQA